LKAPLTEIPSAAHEKELPEWELSGGAVHRRKLQSRKCKNV